MKVSSTTLSLVMVFATSSCSQFGSESYMKKSSEADLIWGIGDDQEMLTANPSDDALQLSDFQNVTLEEIYSGEVAKRFSKEKLEKSVPLLFKQNRECYESLATFRNKSEYRYMFEDIKNFVKVLLVSDKMLKTTHIKGLKWSYESNACDMDDPLYMLKNSDLKKIPNFLVYKVAKFFTEKEISQMWGEKFLKKCKQFAPLGEWTRMLPVKEDTSGLGTRSS